jgi:NADPH:quinone reductase-like Zn-dependent oxidoreductase
MAVASAVSSSSAGPGKIAMSLGALVVGGHVSLIGASLTPSRTGLDPLLLTGRGITLGSISVGSRAYFEAMNRAIAIHRLHPVIDRTFPFVGAREAYRHFEGRGHFGKVVITHG